MSLQIRPITAAETWPIRHLAMWPERDPAFVRLPGDDDAEHFGLFAGTQADAPLVSVISLFRDDGDAQFRKFATLPQAQGLGHGGALLQFLVRHAQAQSLRRLWCNARVERSSFYARHGFVPAGAPFPKNGRDYIRMEHVSMERVRMERETVRAG